MSSSYKWLRLYAEFSTDPKVQMMTEQDQRRLVMLFCIRCGNVTETFHDDQIAFQLRITIDEWMHTKEIFLRNGFIDSDNKLLNWDKRQYASDLSTSRVKKHRNMKKQLLKQDGNVSVTPPDTDTDTEKKKINKKENLKKDVLRELEMVLSPERALAVYEHRKAIGKPMTALAAKLLAGKFSKAPNADAAADMMISNGWQGFELEWMKKVLPANKKTEFTIEPRILPRPDEWNPQLGAGEEQVFECWKDGEWIDYFGPRPDQRGCKVPEFFLRKWRDLGLNVLLPSEEDKLL